MNPLTLASDLDGDGLHIGIVRARFNEAIGLKLLEACLDELGRRGVDERDIIVVSVPGALELGVALAQMAETFQFDALIALGAVVRGDTYHFEVVSNESAAAISRVALDSGIPVANGVLTTEDEAQALARAEQKGRDCANAAIEMSNLLDVLDPDLDDDDDDDDLDEDYDDDLDDDDGDE